MIKKIILACLAVILLAAATVYLSMLADKRNEALQESYASMDSAITARVASLSAASEAEVKRIASLNFYQRLKEGRDVSILVIGDSIGLSAGSTKGNGWTDRLKSDIKKTYGSSCDITQITGGGTTVVRGWVEYNRTQTGKTYDAIFICEGQNDQSYPLSQFEHYYDNLLSRLIKSKANTAIYQLVESSIRKNNDYTQTISDLSNHYGTERIDMRVAFGNSPIPYSGLSKDGVHPNDTGYALYENAILQNIKNNVQANKSTLHNQASPLYDTQYLNTFNFVSTPTALNGFVQGQSGYICSKTGDSVTYTISGTAAIAMFAEQANGGTASIYLDGKYIGKADTKNNNNTTFSVFISDGLIGKHAVKIVSSGSVTVEGVATN